MDWESLAFNYLSDCVILKSIIGKAIFSINEWKASRIIVRFLSLKLQKRLNKLRQKDVLRSDELQKRTKNDEILEMLN